GVVAKTAAMVSNSQAQALARRHGLNILNVTWEDTGRYKGSSVGPNISDMTIQVQQMDPRTERFHLTCMPVIRFPNFSDKTGDLSPDKFFLLVGNERGKALRRVSLRRFLGDLRSYLTRPESWKGKKDSLLAERDTHVLVSAQACFLPIPKHGIATFNPVLFNYQSCKGDPAVLTILATREGTSVTVIDNVRDGFKAGRTWGQRLFFNHKGQRASLTGKRMSDFVIGPGDPKGGGTTPEAGGQAGLNMVLLIQVPLKQKRPMRLGGPYPCPSPSSAPGCKSKRGSDVEDAVIGHGKMEGPFTEIDGLAIERDPRFPLRVTVQFYKATSNGVVSPRDMAEIARQISRVYRDAEYVGSLVTQGDTDRPTEYDGPKAEPPGWWNAFWRRHWENTGQTREETLAMLRNLLGPNWKPKTERELVEAIERLKKAPREE
ncbi:MAG: hypothetical protein ACYTHM_15005, partial [Planctomycetota bacterium]